MNKSCCSIWLKRSNAELGRITVGLLKPSLEGLSKEPFIIYTHVVSGSAVIHTSIASEEVSSEDEIINKIKMIVSDYF